MLLDSNEIDFVMCFLKPLCCVVFGLRIFQVELFNRSQSQVPTVTPKCSFLRLYRLHSSIAFTSRVATRCLCSFARWAYRFAIEVVEWPRASISSLSVAPDIAR